MKFTETDKAILKCIGIELQQYSKLQPKYMFDMGIQIDILTKLLPAVQILIKCATDDSKE